MSLANTAPSRLESETIRRQRARCPASDDAPNMCADSMSTQSAILDNLSCSKVDSARQRTVAAATPSSEGLTGYVRRTVESVAVGAAGVSRSLRSAKNAVDG